MIEQSFVDEFNERVGKERKRYDKIVSFHLNMYVVSDGGVKLPYSGDETYINVNQYEKDEDGYVASYDNIDTEATLAYLSVVAKAASKLQSDGQIESVEKKYDSDFRLTITISNDPHIKVHYTAEREAVCTKKVVGHKVVPAYTSPERVEEVVEWDCQKVSLLSPKQAEQV